MVLLKPPLPLPMPLRPMDLARPNRGMILELYQLKKLFLVTNGTILTARWTFEIANQFKQNPFSGTTQDSG